MWNWFGWTLFEDLSDVIQLLGRFCLQIIVYNELFGQFKFYMLIDNKKRSLNKNK